VNYVSTRGVAAPMRFADVLLEGLATDGGLYVPETWPTLAGIDLDRSYAEVAADVMWPFVDGSIDRAVFRQIVADAYATFQPPEGSSPDVVPLEALGDDMWLAELYWGPTLAFKDIALQLVGRLFDHELSRRNERVMIVGATSGDTGSAAIDAVRGSTRVDIVVLHPHGRTSEVQRRQMTTVTDANVHNVAIEGTFDDCQDLVKAMFGDEAFRREVRLSAVNSINWARVMAQIVYYVTSAAAVRRSVGSPGPVSFCVPTGNFGNIYAGYAAMRMGLEVDQLLIASNHNDILTRFFTSGEMVIHEVRPSLSPSMDIQVSSNLERLLFEMLSRDGAAVSELMMQFRSEGAVSVPLDRLGWLREHYRAGRFSDDQCLGLMDELWRDRGLLVDPHTAVGIGVARELRRGGTPMICLGTAHPAKFPDAVEQATGVRPPLPPHLVDLFERAERYDVRENDLEMVKGYVRGALTTS
jgi:threonine synthase